MTDQKKFNPSIASKFCLFTLFFLYAFSLQFVFVPAGLGTRAIFGVLGFVYIFVVKFDWIASLFSTKKLLITKHQFRIILALFLFWAISFISNAVNGTSEKAFLTFPISMIMIFSSAFMIVDLTRKVYKRLTFEIVTNYLVSIVLIQVYIALAMFLIPELKQLTTIFLVTEGILLDEMFNEDGFRLIGLGVQFFGAGIINSITLLLIAVLLKKNCNSWWRVIYLIFAFLSIFGLGMMMARTTLVGAGMAMGLLALGVKFRNAKSRNLRRIMITLVVFSGFFVALFGSLSIDNKEMIKGASEYGFEMFVNYFETGSASTASSDHLKDMYDTYPTEIKTWVIGDGYYADPLNKALYYMNIDVGYLRLIFYCGLIGMVIFFYYQYSLLSTINANTNGEYKQFLIFIFIFVMIANFKGFTDVTSLMALFMFFTPELKLNNE